MSPDAVVIDHLSVTWRADAGAVERPRLDRLAALLLDGPLEAALLDAGVDPGDEVCIRTVEAPHRVRWDEPDDTIVEGWSRSITGAVVSALADDDHGDRVVRYRSRAQAAVDLTSRALAGDLTREWAWRQLDLWPTTSPSGSDAVARAVTQVLIHEPAAIVPSVVALASHGRLTAFLSQLGSEQLVRLADAAWTCAGGTGPATSSATVAPAPGARHRSTVEGIVARSAIVRNLTGWPGGGRATDTAVLVLAALVVLEVDPASTLRADAGGLLSSLASRLSTLPPRPPAGLLERAGEGTAPASSPRASLPTSALRLDDTVEPAETASSDQDEGERGRPRSDDLDEAAEPGVRTDRRTEWGGLLFLLSLVDQIGLPHRAGSDETLAPLGLPTVLHRVSMVLTGRAAPEAPAPSHTDPGLLAFAGLAPGSDPPTPLVPVDGSQADAAVAHEADRLVARLRAVLEAASEPGELALLDDAGMLLLVTRRPAAVDAEPGWIDVRLDLDEVSTVVRRAGLDLDPGHLPWLGCVVRFRYG